MSKTILRCIIALCCVASCGDDDLPDSGDADAPDSTATSDGDADTDADTEADTDTDGSVGECRSNTDCAEPTSVCDTVYGRCVECLVVSDCAHRPGTVCTMGACACSSSTTYCEADGCVDVDSHPGNCGGCGRICYGACGDGSCLDAWTPIKDEDSCGDDPACLATIPVGRNRHVAVWTGDRMIVWGGRVDGGGATQSGGIYDHMLYEWQQTSLINAPSARHLATAVWTGTEMIVWGGLDDSGHTNTGGRYDPATDTWTPTSAVDAPEGRAYHTAVWTGDRMIVWGGDNATNQVYSGGIYDPVTDTWTATPMPSSGTTRRDHTAVWNSTVGTMMIHGGYGDPPGYADQYLPATNAPGGEQLSLSGGWSVLNTIGEPSSRANHTAIISGGDMIIWGGFSGSVYNSSGARYHQGAWEPLAGSAPEGRHRHTAVVIETLDRMIVWGGESSGRGYLDTGGEYDIAGDTWIAPTPTAPEGRRFHTAVAAGDSMMVWGGEGTANSYLASGGVYTPR